MAGLQRTCVNHSDRPAIGVCMELGVPICAECSTRYDGRNYSREGLRLLHERLAGSVRETRRKGIADVAFALSSPLLFWLLYRACIFGFKLLLLAFEGVREEI